jgi:hypothetical protein
MIAMTEPHLARELLEIVPSGIRESVNDVWGIILGDKLSYYRQRNALKLSKKLHEEVTKLGGKMLPDRVPDQFAYEWTEAATRKSDETVQQIFARLLAKAATEGGSTDERLIYALNEISAEDALLFKCLYGDFAFRAMRRGRGFEISHVHLFTKGLEINNELALDNLVRISLVRELTGIVNRGARYQSLDDPLRPTYIYGTQRLIRPSALGLLLYEQIGDEAEPNFANLRADVPEN